MKAEKIITIFKERWKFYLVGYIIGFVVPIIYDGIPNIYYLIPIKMLPIYCAMILGTAYYYGAKKIPIFAGTYRALKYVIAVILMMILTYVLQQILIKFGIDSSIFIGFPKSK